MNRVQFTKCLIKLLSAMFLDGETPLIDYVKRSDEEQMRLFLRGHSKCDGVKNISSHQRGKAADIYFLNLDSMDLQGPNKGYEYWHDYWKMLVEREGGKVEEMIEWDKGHFGERR